MSSICELSDDLLVKILSLVRTKDAVATSLLSKRWVSLWKLVPRLEYGSSMYGTSSDFIDKFLLLSKTPVLETFHLKLGDKCAPREVERWVDIAAARHVRVLELLHHCFYIHPIPCPRSLFTCKGLVVLRLQEVVIYDIPSTIFLQNLKTLSLICVRFFTKDELVDRLLSACPILETLIVRRWLDDWVTTFTIAVPSLQSLHIMHRLDHLGMEEDDREYVINAPSLKTLKFFDKNSRFRSVVKMPKLVKAEIKIREEDSKNLLGCLTSAKHLSLCLTSAIQVLMPKCGDFFCQLEYLELCTKCSSDWLCLLLRHSPKLQLLRLNQIDCGMFRELEAHWEQPCCVPECLVSSLKTVEWIGYRGTEAEKEAPIYILDKASHLKKMTISRKITNLREKYRMLIDLASRLSSCCNQCRLEFVPLVF